MHRELHSLLRTSAVALAVMGALSVGLGAWLSQLDELVPLPDIPSGTKVVVLGNSIALANVEADRVAGELGRPGGVAQLAERGSQVAHWVAMARHRVFEAGHRPAQVVVVSPLDLLVRERLSSSRDTARLLALLTRPDPELWAVAVGEDGLQAFLGRQRELLRFVSMSALADWLPRLIGVEEALAQARASQSPLPRDPTQRPAWVVDPGAPSAGRAERDPRSREPSSTGAGAWQLLPALHAEATAHTARLWVVVPPVDPRQRRGKCGRNANQHAIADELSSLGVTLLDLTDAEVPPDWFATRSHLQGEGPAWMSDTLAGHLRRGVGGRPGCE